MLELYRRLLRKVFDRPAPARRGRPRPALRLTPLEGRDVPAYIMHIPGGWPEIFQLPAGQTGVDVAAAFTDRLLYGTLPPGTYTLQAVVYWNNGYGWDGPPIISDTFTQEFGEGVTTFYWSHTTAPYTDPTGGFVIVQANINIFVQNIYGVWEWGGLDAVMGVACFNRQPTPVPDEFTVHAGQTISFPISALAQNDLDPDDPNGGGWVSATGVGSPARGTLVPADGIVTYTAPEVISGTQEDDTFTYSVADNLGGSSGDGLVTIHVVNAMPVAEPAALTVMAGSQGDGQLSASDPDGDVVTLESFGEAGHGTVTAGPGLSFHYVTNDPDYDGTDTFTYTVKDGHGGTDTAAVTVTVTPAPLGSGAGGSPTIDGGWVVAGQPADETDEDGHGVVPGAFVLTRPAESTLYPLTVRVRYLSGPGLAEPNVDYVATPSGYTWVTFAAGATTAALAVVPKKDNLVEGTEKVRVAFLGGPGYALNAGGADQAAELDLSDDPPVVTVTATGVLSENTVAGPTGGGFIFSRSGGDVTQPLTVRFKIVGYQALASALNGIDYAVLPNTSVADPNSPEQDIYGSVTIPGGPPNTVPFKFVPVVPIDDQIVEPDEVVTVQVIPIQSPVKTYRPGSPDTASLTIADNDARVCEVDYSGPGFLKIDADPGEPAFGDGPEWVDANRDGDAADPGDTYRPVGYVRATQVTVAAKFAASPGWTTVASPDVRVRGTGPGGLTVPSSEVALSDGMFVLPSTAMTGLLPNTVKAYLDFTIAWEMSADGGATWRPAGTTYNPLYVTLAIPLNAGPIYWTVAHKAATAADGAGTDAAALAGVWTNFSGRAATNRKGEKLYYYKEWDTNARTTEQLLLTRDGQCYAWMDFMRDQLFFLGYSGMVERVELRPVEPRETMLVKNWTFHGNGTLNVGGYTHQNLPKNPISPINPGVIWEKNSNVDGDEKWGYVWGATVEVSDAAGLPGQNTQNPLSAFENHIYLRVDGNRYDPSYGVTYAGLAQVEANMAGYAQYGLVNNILTFGLRKEDPNRVDLREIFS